MSFCLPKPALSPACLRHHNAMRLPCPCVLCRCAPEVFLGLAYNEKADVYSLAVVR